MNARKLESLNLENNVLSEVNNLVKMQFDQAGFRVSIRSHLAMQ